MLGLCFIGTFSACEKEAEEPQVDKPLVYTNVSTIAGDGNRGFVNSTGLTAQFNDPEGIAVDDRGNLYVADMGNNCIRQIFLNGTVTIFAGSKTSGFMDGSAPAARFNNPSDIAIDKAGNLYVTDTGNSCIRKITPLGVVSTLAGTGKAGFADGNAATAQFDSPYSVAVGEDGNVYVADGSYRIRKITPAGLVSTLAGNGTFGAADGPGNAAQFKGIEGLAVTKQGTLYAADFCRIRKITADGTVSTVAGTLLPGYTNGPSNTAQFYITNALALDKQGNLYVAEFNNHCIRKITPSGDVSTFAGTRVKGSTDGPIANAQFNYPSGMTIDSKGNLYITEYSQRIRKITAE